MKRSDHDRLLREILADENLERLREESLARGLTAVRGRRRRRKLLAAVAASLVFATSVFVSLRRSPSSETSPSPRPVERPPTVTTITDEQLLALFPNQAVALVGKPGEQQLLFLDPPKNASAPRENR